MRFSIITCPTKLSILTPPQIFSGDIPFEDISGWLSLRSHVVDHAKRPAKPQPQVDIGRDFDDKLWSLIEECWSQEPSNRPTAGNVSLRLGGVNGYLFNTAEMYKKEIADLTEELERSKAARQDLETELAELRNSLERRELEQVLELEKDLDKERDLRKQVEKNADESKAARQDLETELAELRDSLERRELEQVELKKDLKQAEKNADESKAARQDFETELANLRNSLALARRAIVQRGPIQNGSYGIKSRAPETYWSAMGNTIRSLNVHFYGYRFDKGSELRDNGFKTLQVNNYSPIIQVFRG